MGRLQALLAFMHRNRAGRHGPSQNSHGSTQIMTRIVPLRELLFRFTLLSSLLLMLMPEAGLYLRWILTSSHLVQQSE